MFDGVWCQAHKQKTRRSEKSAEWHGLYDARWQRYRIGFLINNPLCRMCLVGVGRLNPSAVVDHIIPHRGDIDLFWDQLNHQPLCKACHDSKTAREDGGFGSQKSRTDEVKD